MKNPYRFGSWGEKVFMILSEFSVRGRSITVNQLVAELVLKYKIRRPDMERLYKKTYFTIWEMTNKKNLPVETVKVGSERAYILKSPRRTAAG